MAAMVEKSLSMHGFVVHFGEVMQKAMENFGPEATKLVLEGKIKSREHRYYGLKNAADALADVHHGYNYGKSVIIVSEDE